MPDHLADALTGVFILIGLGLILRRLLRAEVRILSAPRDYLLLLLTLAPFITGFMTYHQFGPYRIMLCLHMLTSEILLVLIPFTKLSHAFLFFATRFFIGSDMGGRREREGRVGTRTW
jgi:nitrate reductase gamma subunit